MIGGMTRVRGDVIPFSHAYLDNLVGLNVIGLRRRGVKRAELQRLRQAYRKLFFDEGVFAERIDAVAGQFADDPLVEKIIAFIRVGGKRALMHPSAGQQPNDNGDDAS
jgi:UDP-N-acetylglucosamine acyltransferase